MLIAFGGLPGTGKTTLAIALARKLSALYLRIDTIEQAIVKSGALLDTVGSAGYCVGYAIAIDNLHLGATVVADSVNSLTFTRNAWRDVAKETNVPFVEIEVICSDLTKHRQRVESRKADIVGHKLPSWQNVLDRQYDSWKDADIVIDTAILSAEQGVDDLIKNLNSFRNRPVQDEPFL